MSEVLFNLEAATIARTGGECTLSNFHWSIRDGESWTIVGPVGAGKTTLAEAMLGRHQLVAGVRRWPMLARFGAAHPSDVVRLVAFCEDSRLFSPSKHYYQQRFNFIEPADDLSLEQFLRSTSDDIDAIEQMASHFGLLELLPLSFLKLSHGQSRRARLAQALLARPEILILDDPFLGLDSAVRGVVTGMLGRLVESGSRLVLITRRLEIPDWSTHVLELESGRIHWQGQRCDFAASAPEEAHVSRAAGSTSSAEPIIELRNARVAYGDKLVLRDVWWIVNAGEKWAVLGPNGAGKTTLLSLLCGDHPQAYSNDIRLFDRQRGSGESIWDIKRNVGLVSPELHVYFTEPLTARQAAATGFSDTLTPRPITKEQEGRIRELFGAFGISALADHWFGRLSAGQQRLVLLVRALVKDPPLLILDEPFQGLDEIATHRARTWLERNLRPDQTLLFVTHYPEEIPGCATRRLHLDEGCVARIE